MKTSRLRRRVRRNVPVRIFNPGFDSFEQRQLLTVYTGYLQGTAFIDQNNNQTLDSTDSYLQGATIDLLQGSTVIKSTTTDQFGQYLFTGLVPGNYTIRETAAPNHVPTGTQAQSQLNPITGQTYNTISVTVADPNNVWAGFNGVGASHFITDKILGVAEGNTIGQLKFTLGTSASNISNLSSEFFAYCGDDLHSLSNITGGDKFQVLPSPMTSIFNGISSLDPVRAGQVAYIFNHHSDANTAITAGALQLAIWELIYDTPDTAHPYGDLTAGNFMVTGPFAPTTAADVAAMSNQAYAWIQESLGKRESATYLDATLGGTVNINPGSQGILAKGSFNFANIPASSISGFVYVDADNDGIKASTEAPIGGVTVTLTGTDDLGAVTKTTTTANTDGSYSFTNLRPGTYVVTESQPSAYLDGKDTIGTPGGTTANDVFSNIVLGSGVNGTDNNFGELVPSSIAGFVYVDADNNGIKASTEAPIGGVTVTLTGTDDLGAVTKTTTTANTDGSYSFTNLRPGTYVVTESQPSAYLDGKDTIGTPGGSTANDVFSNIVLGSGVNGTDNNFGELLGGSVSGLVFVDTNNDGQKQSTESFIGGVTITLTGTDDLGNPVSKTTTTSTTDGTYSFTNLRPGTYVVTESQPSGYFDGKDSQGTTVLPNSSTTDAISGIVLVPGGSSSDNNFGELAPGSISGAVYVDLNNNGQINPGENGIPNVPVTLTGTDYLNRPVSLTVNTGPGGAYSFTNLAPGSYSVSEPTQPNGYFDGLDSQGFVVIGGSNTTDTIGVITLGSGGTSVENNLGELPPGAITGFVYIDTNNNGTKDTGEVGIPSVTLVLTGTDYLGNSVTTPGTTGTDGSYSFTGLRPGIYTVTETQPGTYLDGLDAKLGTVIPASVGTDVISTLTVTPQSTLSDNNFGELVPASIAGFVYVDADNNGIKASTEAPIGGVTVTLTGTDDLGAVTKTTTTANSDGSYSFTGLRPGTYVVTESQPSAYLDGKDSAGSLGGVSANDVTTAIPVKSGDAGINYNFGEIIAASISGYVYVDADNNGIKASTEAPIGGVTVTLTGTDDLGAVTKTTTTANSDGSYSFTGLRPGTYVVTESQPSAYLDGKDSAGSLGGVSANDVTTAIPVKSGDAGINYNFGEIVAASISGFVYVDADNDGQKLSTEDFIGGVTVTLTGTDDLGNAVTKSTTTSTTDGSYSFTGLRPGTYSVAEPTQPSGYFDGKDARGTTVLPNSVTTDSIPAIVLASGGSATDNNFGELAPAQVSGVVFVDDNNDGLIATTDALLGGVSIRLTGTDYLGTIITLSTTTQPDGSYLFTGLKPGSYSVSEPTQPAGYFDGLDSLEGNPIGGSWTSDLVTGIVLASGDSSEQNNFGELAPAKVSGFVYADADNDGTFDSGETPLSGVTVKIIGVDYLGVSYTATTPTLADGSYTFGNLKPGTYTVSEPTQPTGYYDGLEAKNAVVIPNSYGVDTVSAITVGSGDTAPNNNFGELAAAQLSGYVYVDANDDGVRLTTDTGLTGISITLTGTDYLGGTVSLSTTTGTGGFYSFTNLKPGSYTVTQPTQPSGYNDGLEAKAGVVQLGTHGTDTIAGIALGSGANVQNNNFGEVPITTGTVSGRKYQDLTGNGLTSDDTPLGGVTIQLYRDLNNSGTLDSYDGAPYKTLVTGTDGKYSFTGLGSGRYFVSEVVATGWVRTFPTLNTYYTVNVAAGTSSTGNDFANFQCDCDCSTTLSNVYFTTNGGSTTFTNLRGYTNQGDLVTVTFTVAAGATETLSFVTYTAPANYFDANTASQQKVFDSVTRTFTAGTYSMTVQIPNGNYQIDFVCGEVIDTFGPAGSNIFYTPQCRLISADNDGTQPALPVASYASLAGNVWVDKDSNGLIGTGETGLGGVTVKLTGTDDLGKAVTLTRVTNPDGTYSFKGLRPGTYKVTETQPAGYTTTKNAVGKVGTATRGTLATPTTDAIDAVILALGENGLNYNFGELASTGLVHGCTATIGYWQNPNGQALIKSFNGSSSSTQLGNWLATNFPRLYGSSCGSNNLTGKTNTQVAAYYSQLFSANKKTECQVLCTALSVYATTSSLGGTQAASYGFRVNTSGTGAISYNVGTNGSTFGVANNTSLTIMQLLKYADSQSVNGALYNNNTTKKNACNVVFSDINVKGDLTA